MIATKIGDEERVNFIILGNGMVREEQIPDYVCWGLLEFESGVKQYAITSLTDDEDIFIIFENGIREVINYNKDFKIAYNARGVSITTIKKSNSYQKKLLTTIKLDTGHKFYCLSNKKLIIPKINELGKKWGRIVVKEGNSYL